MDCEKTGMLISQGEQLLDLQILYVPLSRYSYIRVSVIFVKYLQPVNYHF